MKKMQVVAEPCSEMCVNFQLLLKIIVSLKEIFFYNIIEWIC